jgi:hypothetical protein
MFMHRAYPPQTLRGCIIVGKNRPTKEGDSNQFYLPAQIQLQLTAVYYVPANILQGGQLLMSSVDLGVKKKLNKGKGEIPLSFSDIFNTFGIRQKIKGDGVSVFI